MGQTRLVEFFFFEAIDTHSLTADAVAQRISADPRAIGLLLDVLEALGYVEKKDRHYANTKMTIKWILASSPNSLACMISGMEGALDRWRYLGETIRVGSPPLLAWEWLDQHPGSWRDYQAIMIGMAHSCMGEIVTRVKLPPTAKRLIDLAVGTAYTVSDSAGSIPVYRHVCSIGRKPGRSPVKPSSQKAWLGG